jgi:hypothetical protein
VTLGPQAKSGRWVRWALTTSILCGIPAGASAAVLTYSPTPSDLGDLDHRYVYTWKISGINIPTGDTVLSAKLTFKNLYNWDTNPNQLFVHLLDTAKGSGVRSFQDETATQGPMIDDFVNTRYHNDSSWLVANGTADTFLTSRSFAAMGATPETSPGQANPAGWSYVADGVSSGKQLYTYTYVFNEGQEDALESYINASSYHNIALGFDPDCHFFNDGVKLTIVTGYVPVPEPAALLLLGMGGFAALRRYRRQRA